MTAQVAIMNKKAIALASDNAISSIKGRKHIGTEYTARKLYPVSKRNKIGIMIHGLWKIDSISWARIIQEYRNRVSTKNFDYLGECAIDFMQYIKGNRKLHQNLKDYMSIETNVVIAGFGKKQRYPSIICITIRKKKDGKLKVEKEEPIEIDKNHSNSSVVLPVADSNDIEAFVTGIHPRYWNYLVKKMKTHLHDKSLCIEILDDLALFEVKKFRTPFFRRCETMSQDDLAIVAETFINLASFRQKVSRRIKTVGGPIDVAVITKEKGFEWIKRKRLKKKQKK